MTTIGAMCRMMLIKLDWFGTMLPRISVSVTKTLEQKLRAASQPDRSFYYNNTMSVCAKMCACVQANAEGRGREG